MTVLARTRITPGKGGLTEMQLRIARYIDAYRIKSGSNPSIADIAKHFRMDEGLATDAVHRLTQLKAIKGYGL